LPAPKDQHYVAFETGISVIINVVISAAFMFLVFGRTKWIDLWGPHGLAVDFVPQTFMISLMSVIVPTLLTRKRLRDGQITPRTPRAQQWPRNLALRALLMALGMTVVLGGAATLLLASFWTAPQPFWPVFGGKLAYGAITALIVTPIGLSLALTELPRSHKISP
jgi:hypothetical protein